MFIRVILLGMSGFATMALAQVPATTTPSARPAHSCVRPEVPSRLATNNQAKTYDKDVLAYRDCLQAFVKAQADLVKLHAEVGNNAVKEYNDYVTEMSKRKEEAAK